MDARRGCGLALLTLFVSLPAAAGPLAVSGAVSTPAGFPIAGARAQLVPIQSNHEWGRMVLAGQPYPKPAVATVSDAAGRFTLAAPEAGLWTVVVESPGFLPMQFSPLSLTGAAELPAVVLPKATAARFTVLAPEGGPAAGAWLFASTATPAVVGRGAPGTWAVRPRLGVAAATGAVELPRAEGERLNVQVYARGMLPARQTGVEGGQVALRAAAGPRRWIEVRGPDGRPLAGVQVRLEKLPLPEGTTGGAGRLELLPPASGEPRLRLLSADGGRLLVPLPPPAAGSTGPAVLVLPPPAPLRGRVLDAETRQPLPGALVWFNFDPGAFVRAGAGGDYRVVPGELDDPLLQAEAAGHLPFAGKLPTAPAGRGPSIALDPAAGLSGLVVDGQGVPLARVRLQAVLRTTNRQRLFTRSRAEGRTLSGPDGRFTLDRLSPGETYELRAVREGYAPTRVTVAALERSRTRAGLRVVMGRGRAAFGRVVDSARQPVAQAEITLMAATGERSMARERRVQEGDGLNAWKAVAGADGRYTIPALPAGPVDLRVSREGFAAAAVRGVPIPAGEGAFDLGTVTLEPSVTLLGRVVDRAGAGVAEASVYAGPELRPLKFEMASPSRQADAVSGADGRFSLPDLRRGDRVELGIRKSGYSVAFLQGVAVPTKEPVLVTLARTSRVTGQVVDPEGRPIARAELDLRSERPGERGPLRFSGGVSSSALSDADGRFVLEPATPGAAAELAADADGYQPAVLSDLQVPADHDLENVRVVLEHGAVLEGRVLTGSGDPVDDARVICASETTVSDADGYYRVEGLPLGEHNVRAIHSHYPVLDRKTVVLERENHLDLVFPDGREVSGRVVSRAGKPVEGAAVALFPPGSPKEDATLSGADGAFHYTSAADGDYSLRVEKEGWVTAELPLGVRVAGAPVRNVEVRLDKGGRISGRILGLDPHDLAEVEVRARQNSEADKPGRVDYEGRYEVSDLGPADWLVSATLRDRGRETHGRVTLEPGGEGAALDLEFGRDPTLSGRVTRSGEPLAGANLFLRGLDVAASRGATTDFEGAFRLADLKPGRYRLQVVDAPQLLSHSEDLQITADREVRIDLSTVRVSGVVTDVSSSAPLPNALAALRRIVDGEAAFLVTVGTDADGFFNLPGVTEGQYRLTVTRDGYTPLDRDLDIRAGAGLQDLKLQLSPAAGIDLDARLASGSRPPRLAAAFLDPSGRVVLLESRPVDPATGHARFPGVPAGAWRILATAPGGALTEVRATVPGAAVPLVLPDAGSLLVRVPALAASDQLATLTLLDAAGRPFRTISAYGTIQAQWTLEGGKAVVEGVPAGAWSLTARTPDGRSWTGTVATTGGAAEIQLNN
jgi:hypothetical protein